MGNKENVTIDIYIYDEDKILEQSIKNPPRKAIEIIQKYIDNDE